MLLKLAILSGGGGLKKFIHNLFLIICDKIFERDVYELGNISKLVKNGVKLIKRVFMKLHLPSIFGYE